APPWPRRSPHAPGGHRRALSTDARAGEPVACCAGALVHLGVTAARTLRTGTGIPWHRAGSHARGAHGSAALGARAGVALGRLWHGDGLAAARESARHPPVAAR